MLAHSYTIYEGGDWIEFDPPWDFTKEMLETRCKSKTKAVMVSGMTTPIHSLAFDTPIANFKFTRWDCINGFTRGEFVP